MASKGIQVRLEGVDQVVRELEKAGVRVQDGLEAICNAGAEVVQAAIEQRAPGTLGEDVVRETVEKSAKRVVVHAGPSEERWYARYIEFGTPPHAVKPKTKEALRIEDSVYAGAKNPGLVARPFVRPAADESEDAAQRAMGNELEEIVG